MNRQALRAARTAMNTREDISALDLEPPTTHAKRKRSMRRANRRANKQIAREVQS
jgi:hypothetical protein